MSENVLKELEKFIRDNAYDIVVNFDDAIVYLVEEMDNEYMAGRSSGHYGKADELDFRFLSHMTVKNGEDLVDLYQDAFENYVYNNFPYVDELCALYNTDNIISIMFSSMNLNSVISESEVEEIIDTVLEYLE